MTTVERLGKLEREVKELREQLCGLLAFLFEEDLEEEIDPLELGHQKMMDGVRSEREGTA